MAWDDFLSVLDQSVFEETPVDLDTFVSDPKFLGKLNFRLSPIQSLCVRMASQIYRKETLESYLPQAECQKRWAETKNEVILQLGKGSGKDWMMAVAVCYVVYLLLCLKDPSAYYGNSSGDRIDILNIAINATQASNVFFNNVSRMIKSSEWFADKYDAKPSGDPMKANEFNFIKEINVYSGHSEREAWEGYNIFMVILDEIAGFALESASPHGKTADAIYKMYRASVVSRYAEFGKYVSMSFPRYKGDFIQQRYDAVVAGKQVVKRREVMKIDEELPDGVPGNEIVIEWDEDHIEYYKGGNRIFALKRPPWDVNPTKSLRSYVSEFVDDYTDALARFACMPPDAVDAFFKDRTKIEEAFGYPNGVNNEDGTFHYDFKPKEDKMYFVHVDLAQKHDRCGVAMAHVDRWVRREIAGKTYDPAPEVIVDALRFWEPSKGNEVDFAEVQDYIISLQRKGFNLRLVTFDQWRSEDMIRNLNAIGIRSDILKVKKDQFVDMAVIMNEGRLRGPDEPKLREELLQLRLLPNGKVDHTRQGYKDLSDATCGAIYNAISKTPRDLNTTVEVKKLSDYTRPVLNTINDNNVIKAPSVKERMPAEIAALLQSMKVI